MPHLCKRSYAIACFKKQSNGQYSVLAVRNRTSYYFSKLFTLIKNDQFWQKVSKCANNMTHQEKIDVLSLPMDELWIRVFESVRLLKRMYTGTNIEIDSDNHDYKNLYKKFESNYMFLTCCDNKKKLIEVFNNATSIELPWGLPKGRSDDRKETPIETAMREFKEETGVKKYTMLHHIKPVVYSYIDDNTKYEFVIFFAETTQNASINLLNPDQVNEISAIEFVNSETLAAKKQVRMLDLFRILKKKYKNHR